MDDNNMMSYFMGRDANGTGFGGGGVMWVLLFLFLMNGGFGGFGGWGNRGGFAGPPPNVATQADVFGTAAWQNTQGKIDTVAQSVNALGMQGLSQANAINQNVSQQGADTRLQICQNKGEITSGLAALGYAVNNGQQNIERAIDQARYDNAQQTCNITTNDTANTQKVLDKLCQMEANMQATRIQELTVANQALSLQNAMAAQTAQIVNTVVPRPTPAWPVFSPYQSVWGYGYGSAYGPGYGYGNFT